MNEKYKLMEYKIWGFNAEFVKIINDFIIGGYYQTDPIFQNTPQSIY